MATYNGTSADDVFVGTPDNDTMTGIIGNDTLSGLDGADSLEGGLGDDSLVGGAGADTLDGGGVNRLGGADTIDAGAGDDLVAVRGATVLTFGPGSDRVSLQSLSGGPVVIADFSPGAAGDVFDAIGVAGTGTMAGSASLAMGRLFERGIFQLRIAGADTELIVRPVLGGGPMVAAVFKNTSAADFTAANFAGLRQGTFEDPRVPMNTALSGEIYDSIYSDTITGSSGADTFFAQSGDDSLNGVGGEDRIVFSYAFANAGIGFADRAAVVNGATGRERIANVELFQFTDGVIRQNDSTALIGDQRALVDDLFYYGARKDVFRVGT